MYHAETGHAFGTESFGDPNRGSVQVFFVNLVKECEEKREVPQEDVRKHWEQNPHLFGLSRKNRHQAGWDGLRILCWQDTTRKHPKFWGFEVVVDASG